MYWKVSALNAHLPLRLFSVAITSSSFPAAFQICAAIWARPISVSTVCIFFQFGSRCLVTRATRRKVAHVTPEDFMLCAWRDILFQYQSTTFLAHRLFPAIWARPISAMTVCIFVVFRSWSFVTLATRRKVARVTPEVVPILQSSRWSCSATSLAEWH